jgi:hypothetical protein
LIFMFDDPQDWNKYFQSLSEGQETPTEGGLKKPEEQLSEPTDYTSFYESLPEEPGHQTTKWETAKEMAKLAGESGRAPIPTGSGVFAGGADLGDIIKNIGGGLKSLGPDMLKLAKPFVEPIFNPGKPIMEQGMAQAAKDKAKAMGVEMPEQVKSRPLDMVKNALGLVRFWPETMAKFIKDPVGTFNKEPVSVLALAAGGSGKAIGKWIKKVTSIDALTTADVNAAFKETIAGNPKLGVPPELTEAFKNLEVLPVTEPTTPPIPDTAGVIPREQIPTTGKSALIRYMEEQRVKGYSEKELAREEGTVRDRAKFANMSPDEYVIKQLTPIEKGIAPVAPPTPLKTGPGEVKGLGIEFVNDKGEPISRAEAFRGRQARVEPSIEEPGKMKIVMTPAPPVNDHIAIVQNAIKEAFPVRREQGALYRAEMQKRVAGVAEAGKKIPGEAGFYAKLGELKGPLPKAEFESIRGKISQENIDGLFNMIQSHPELSTLDKVSAGEGLSKLFGEFGGGVPQPKQLAMLEKVFGPEFVKTVSDKTPFFKKMKSLGIEIANIPRAFMASTDLSFGLRQGVVLAATHPAIFWKNFPKQFKWFVSEKAFNASNAEIASRPTFDLMNEAGLSLTNMGKQMIGREEPFQSPLAEKIPIAGSIVKASNRAYSGFANKLRADTFDYLVKRAETSGRDPHTDIGLAKDIATVVNTGSGRGSLGKWERAGPALNAFFFSPKLMASRLQMLNPVYYIKLDKLARVEALRQLVSTAGAGVTIMGLAKMAGAEVGTDWRSADFGKIKIGNTRLDIGGGFLQYFRTFGQLWTKQVVSSTTGKVTTLGEGYKPMNRLDIAMNAIQYKEAPVVSFATSWLKGQGAFGGAGFDLKSEIAKRFVPLVIQDLIDVYKDDPSVLPISALGIFGVGLQTYSPSSYTKRHGTRKSLQW